ncbi:MAG: type II toxin-antitoxin system VapB family antitoxin [Acidobacteriota bacterium]|nr:type II toxin-antitoxin system VapB family antitoxin [Acidobacteriota bacterium]
MRTNIDIEDQLMKRAMRSNGTKTKRATVEEALQLLIQIRAQQGIRKLWGIGGWEGDLEKSRLAHGEE